MAGNVRQLIVGLACMVGSAVFAVVALLVLIGAFVKWLATIVGSEWLSALIVGGVLLLLALGMALWGAASSPSRPWPRSARRARSARMPRPSRSACPDEYDERPREGDRGEPRRLDDTIDRIQGRLSVPNLVDEMLGNARRVPALNTTYDSALEAVRRNPVPVLLIAAGVGLLSTGWPATPSAAAPRSRPSACPP